MVKKSPTDGSTKKFETTNISKFYLQHRDLCSEPLFQRKIHLLKHPGDNVVSCKLHHLELSSLEFEASLDIHTQICCFLKLLLKHPNQLQNRFVQLDQKLQDWRFLKFKIIYWSNINYGSDINRKFYVGPTVLQSIHSILDQIISH